MPVSEQLKKVIPQWAKDTIKRVGPSLTRKSLVTHYFRARDYPKSIVASFGRGKHYLLKPHLETDKK